MEKLGNKALYTIARELYFAKKNRQKAEYHEQLFKKRVSKAESLARGLGNGDMRFGPAEWWFDEDGAFNWRVDEDVGVNSQWQQGVLPNIYLEMQEQTAACEAVRQDSCNVVVANEHEEND